MFNRNPCNVRGGYKLNKNDPVVQQRHEDRSKLSFVWTWSALFNLGRGAGEGEDIMGHSLTRGQDSAGQAVVCRL